MAANPGGEPDRLRVHCPRCSSADAGAGNALTRHIAGRWGKQGIRSNCVVPGVVLTESAKRMALSEEALAFAQMTMPSPRFGEPEDVAGVVAFLLSDDAEWINGQVWSINGGVLLRE